MKKIFNNIKLPVLLGFIFTVTSCDRDLSDEAKLASYPNTAEVFIDGFSGGLEYLPFLGTKLNAFTVDDQVKYEGTASMRFDVPNEGDPDGAFAGAIFADNGGRDLSGFDALTFWAKGSKAGTINSIGFGADGVDKFRVAKNNLRITTGWKKYTIPIPDPSKLTFEKGMFWYAEGPEGGEGYTFWVDQLQYEKLGTVAQPRPAIFNGVQETATSFIGASLSAAGLTQTFNLEDGTNETVAAAPSYFTFTSSNTEVASVGELGNISILAEGTAIITATLGGVRAAGSLTIESLGSFQPAPIPTRNAADVISIFSDAYASVAVDFYNGFFGGQTTQGGANLDINGDIIINYTDLNFVTTSFTNPTVNTSEMTHFHVDIQVQESIDPGDFLRVELVDFGSDGSFGGGNDTGGSVTLDGTSLSANSWVSFDLPIANFIGPAIGGAVSGGPNGANMSQITFATDASISSILVDNMYFYK